MAIQPTTAVSPLPVTTGSPKAESRPVPRLNPAPLDGTARTRLSRQRGRAAGKLRVEITVTADWHKTALKLLARLLARVDRAGAAMDRGSTEGAATRRDLRSIRRRLKRFYMILRDEEVGRIPFDSRDRQ